jgi:hypothetical protein
MLRGLELNNAQRRNSVFEPRTDAAFEPRTGAAQDLAGREDDVPYHPRWAIMQVCINLALWAAIIAGAMLIVPRL